MALLLLLLQYDGLTRIPLSFLGRYTTIPATCVFLAVLVISLIVPNLSWPKTNYYIISLALSIVVFLSWLLAASWAYVGGSAVPFASPRDFLVVGVLTTVLMILGVVTRQTWLYYVAIAFFMITAAFSYFSRLSFSQDMPVNSPLEHIQFAIRQFQNGHGFYNNPPDLYLPFLVLPYLPFGLLNLDLRWANVVGILGILVFLIWVKRSNVTKANLLLIALFFLSPAVLFLVFHAQVVFYWFYLALFVFAVKTNRIELQRSSLLVACLSRQLAWPLVLPWLIVRYAASHRSDLEGKNDLGRNGKLADQLKVARFHWLTPNLFDLTALGITMMAFLSGPQGFLYSAFGVGWADASRADPSLPQPVGSYALTPLLPFAHLSYLLLGFQIVLCVSLTIVLLRTRYLLEHTVQSLILIYILFLSFNFMVYDGYWFDVIAMLLVSWWTEPL